MKIKLTLLPLVASSLLIGLPAFADLKNIGREDANGIYEPGYLNYQHARERSSTPKPGSNFYETGSINASGHYEPNYVNYPIPQSEPGEKKTKLEQLSDIGYHNREGIYEPGYVNYNYPRK